MRPEEARKALAGFRAADLQGWKQRAVERIPRSHQEMARSLLQMRPEDPHPWSPGGHDHFVALGATLDALGPDGRQPLFAGLFPRLADSLEQCWSLGVRLTYRRGAHGNAFRAPLTPETTHATRSTLLVQQVSSLSGYDPDPAWLAAWTPHLGEYWAEGALGFLLAAAMDQGGAPGEEVFRILTASARGEHAVGTMGSHVPRALLTGSDPAGWEFIERLLLAAQREEGLRQAILESAAEAHPDAFTRMLRIIVEHDLLRFSAAVRALDVWFGFQYEVDDRRHLGRVLQQTVTFFESPAARKQGLRSPDAETVYLALWCMATRDAVATVPEAARILDHPDPAHRYAAVTLLSLLGLVASDAALLPALDDADPRVALLALQEFAGSATAHPTVLEQGLFDRIERALLRLPEKAVEMPPLVWPWALKSVDRRQVGNALVVNLGNYSPSRLAPHLGWFDADVRGALAHRLARAEARNWDSKTRDLLLALTGDASFHARDQALKALGGCRIEAADAIRLEAYLTRSAGDLRRGVLALLADLGPSEAMASADRLLASSNARQRLAGLDLLRSLSATSGAHQACQERAAAFRAQRPILTDDEERAVRLLLGERNAEPSLSDALGLADPSLRTLPPSPKERAVSTWSPSARALVRSLDQELARLADRTVEIEHWDGSRSQELLGALRWGFPTPSADSSLDEDRQRLPLLEEWEKWWQGRPAACRDPDGLEAIRGLASVHAACRERAHEWPGLGSVATKLFGPPENADPHADLSENILKWIIRHFPPKGAADFLLDAIETSLALVPADELGRKPDPQRYWETPDWRDWSSPMQAYVSALGDYRTAGGQEWTAAHTNRLYRLLRWMDEPVREGLPAWGPGEARPVASRALPTPHRDRPDLTLVLEAFEAGGATEADLFDQLLGPRSARYPHDFSELRQLTGRATPEVLKRNPWLAPFVERCRERILEVELARGESATAASLPAMALRASGGLNTLARVLTAMGKTALVRGWSYDGESRGSVFSHLIRVSFPAEGDSPVAFATRMRVSGVPDQRLLEVALFAPQWATHVEETLEWPGLAGAVWWIHAHTKDLAWSIDQEVREAWQAELSEYTPLAGSDLLNGAVDVDWFRRAHSKLGDDRWRSLDRVVHYASGGGGHKRAQLFAEAMLGHLDRAVLETRIRDKRHQDSVRALGLLPLPSDPAAAEVELLNHYQALHEFLRTSRQFGAQRRESEKLAATVGLENLARTAGYPDPIRLEWAMEAGGVADLAEGAVVVEKSDVRIALQIDPFGQPDLKVSRGDKLLRAIPAALKKDPDVAALRARVVELKRQVTRIRRSLEEAMCRGDEFTGAELAGLLCHPILAPFLRGLVLVGDGIAGYPSDDGKSVIDSAGKRHRLTPDAGLRVAHPCDFLARGDWHDWQRECFRHERIQPFKQVFRELYVLTPDERQESTRSLRYGGHQIQPRQGLALLGTRGWVHKPDEGGARRTFHREGLTAWLLFDEGFTTPAEVEGLTLAEVRFTRRHEWQPIPLESIPPRLFSEAMRDLDLVVSVAHRGGVDPEATASTVDMRATLVQETADLLGLKNVRVQDHHVIIEGELSTYSVHLGSAGVHLIPGGHLCIVAVPSQHRGRLFLPFADDDPRTAEVLSKVLLLSRDGEIRDPTILEQIRGR